MDIDEIQGNLFFTLSMVWKGEPIVDLPQDIGLLADPQAADIFEKYYRIAHRFVFNEGYDYKFLHLGTEFIVPTEEIGRCRIDVVQTEYKVHDVKVISVHFKPLQQDIAPDNALTEVFLRAVAYFISTFLYGVRQGVSYENMQSYKAWAFAHRQAKSREGAQPVTLLTYASLCNVLKAQYDMHLDRYAKELYSLLFAHAEGVSKDAARKHLAKNAWSSTDFFTTYFQPGALITVSRAHPQPDYKSKQDYFLQQWLNEEPHSRTVHELPSPPDPQAGQTPDYDKLPEYPPLRYLGLLTGISSAIYEENLRDIHSRVMGIAKLPWYRPENFLPGNLLRLSMAWATATSLEHLRLPVSRYFARQLVDSKQQESLAASIGSLSGSKLNQIVVFLALFTFFGTLAQILLADKGWWLLTYVVARLEGFLRWFVYYLCLV